MKIFFIFLFFLILFLYPIPYTLYPALADCTPPADQQAVSLLNNGLLPQEVTSATSLDQVDLKDKDDPKSGAYYKFRHPEEGNLIQRFLGDVLTRLIGLFARDHAIFEPCAGNLQDFAPKTSVQQQAELPTELMPKDNDELCENFLGIDICIPIPLGLTRRGAKNLGAKDLNDNPSKNNFPNTVGVYNQNLPTELLESPEPTTKATTKKTQDVEKLQEQAWYPEGIHPITGP